MTREPVRVCSDRFAAPPADAHDDMLQWGDFIYVLDLYERSSIKDVTLLGAEPNRHADAIDMVDYALERGFDVRVLGTGIMSASDRDRLAALWGKHQGRRLDFVVDVGAGDGSEEARQAQEAFFTLAGPRVALSYEIAGGAFDLGRAFDAIARFGVNRLLRLGLTLPAGAQPLSALPPSYRSVADRLESLVPQFRATGVTPMFDCGFPVCMFSDAQLGALTKLGAGFNFACASAVEIGPDLALWPSLERWAAPSPSLYDFDDMDQIAEYYQTTLSARRPQAGMLTECESCDIRRRHRCGGGCLAHQIIEVPIEQVDPAARRRSLAII